MHLNVEKKKLYILSQPTDESCGPTCLQAVYNYYGDFVDLQLLIDDVKKVEGGGTIAVMLGNHALSRGYKADIYTNNLQVFDPTWFVKGVDIISKLKEQAGYKKSKKLKQATQEYLQFLSSGGKIHFKELKSSLIRNILKKNLPILTGLSATYLYQTAREIPETNTYHDTKGQPVGHFVIICGYDEIEHKVLIADPLTPNPIHETEQYYHVDIQRLINSILLGILTYDANILIIYPK